nr:MAG TPA: hypothetical protein [Caudoviricetes sp.]
MFKHCSRRTYNALLSNRFSSMLPKDQNGGTNGKAMFKPCNILLTTLYHI